MDSIVLSILNMNKVDDKYFWLYINYCMEWTLHVVKHYYLGGGKLLIIARLKQGTLWYIFPLSHDIDKVVKQQIESSLLMNPVC